MLWLALAFVGIKLSGLMLSTAKRLGGLSVSQVLSRGEERFILYLRAFDVDDVILPAPRLPLLSNLVSLRPFPARVEDELFDVADGYRPLIAVGKPGTRRAASGGGAYRAYLDDSGWQSYVLEMIRRAERIVIMLKNTDGVRWELSRILDRGAVAKTLFLFDPSAEDPRQWQILAGAMLPMFDIAGVTLSAGSFQGQPLGFAVRDGQLIEFNNANWTATSYRTAFSHFLANR